MDSVLKNRNENSTACPALNLSLLKADGGGGNSSSGGGSENICENAKENHNPKSLLEIASDSTKSMNLENLSTPSKKTAMGEEIGPENNENCNTDSFKANSATENSTSSLEVAATADIPSNWTSTPLNHKSLSRLASQERALNDSYDMPINLESVEQEHVPGLSFLLSGFNNMNINVLPASDDEDDEFLSFNNNQLASQQNSVTEAKEVINGSDGDKTFEAPKEHVENSEVQPKAEPVTESGLLVSNEVEADLTPTYSQEESSENAVQEKTENIESKHELSDAIQLNKTEVIEKSDNQSQDIFDQTKVLEKTNVAPDDLNKTEIKESLPEATELIEKASDQLQEIFDLTKVLQTNTSLAKGENLSVTDTLEKGEENSNITVTIEGNQEQENLSTTAVFEKPPVVYEPKEVEKLETSLQDVSMKSINETFEQPAAVFAPAQETSAVQEIMPPNKFEFIKPSILPPPKAPASEEMFTNATSYNFGDSDFDFLQNYVKGPADDIGRDSVLLKFDPLFEKVVPHKQLTALTETKEEDSFSDLVLKDLDIEQHSFGHESHSAGGSFANIDEFTSPLPNAKSMSVDIMKDISSQNDKIDPNLECEDIKLSSINNEEQNIKFMELENKLKMEAEQREEALLKRISEKDKQISKMNNVVEAYEKAIAELIAEKEQLIQSYEKKCNDLKGDSEINAQHLASLESTFSDLHAKYERTKQIASELKDREESILQDRKTLQDSLKMQEARYEKMKTHAMAQLEIANNKLADMIRNHQAEATKLKAQLKKEEISRASVHEQLIQKSKENAELVKICDELIGNHGNSQTA